MIPSDKTGEVLGLIASDFGTGNCISLIVVSLCLESGLQTGNASWIYGFLICIRGSCSTSPKLAINSDPYFRTGNYFI
jgi:hypothetical protein